MVIKLFVKRVSDDSEPDEYIFEDEVITIGRDGSNRLTLPDPKRVLSKQHAEVRLENDTAYVVDLGSKNFTYLNGQRLEANQPAELLDGDTFQVGEFEVRYEPFEPTGPTEVDFDNRTVFDVSFINPFKDDMERLVETLRRIGKTYAEQPVSRRDDALHDAFEPFRDLVASPTRVLLADLLGLTPDAPTEPGLSLEATATPTQPVTPPAPPPPKEPTVAAKPPEVPVTGGDPSWQDRVIDVLLRGVARLVGIPAQFRYEFIGQTIIQAPETAFLYENDPAILRGHLFDPSASEAERADRLAHVDQAMKALASHQVALLEGYRASTREGARQLIEMLDPKTVIDEVTEEKGMYKAIPTLAKAEAADRLQEKCADLMKGDWSVAEQRVYRPAFIRAYLSSMASASR